MTPAPPRLWYVKHIWAATLWVLAVSMTLAGTIVLLVGSLQVGLVLYMHAILVTAGAAVVSIRNHVDKLRELMHGAFTMGRDYERGELRGPAGL